MRITGDDHVETIGAQIDRGDDVRDFACHDGQRQLLDRAHIENDEPQPHVVLAFGIVAPPELEVLGGEATPVVILGRLDDSGVDCSIPARCGRALVVDHVAWSAGT